MNPTDVEVTDADILEALRLSGWQSHELPEVRQALSEMTGTHGPIAAHARTLAALRTQAPMPAASAEPVGYVVEQHMNRKREFERHGTVMYDRPLGMATMPVYAAPPVQAPMPGKVGELVEWVQKFAKGPDTTVDEFDKLMDAAALIQSLQREVEKASHERDCAFETLEEQQRLAVEAGKQLAAAQRVKDEAVGLLNVAKDGLATALMWSDDDGTWVAHETVVKADKDVSAFIAQHGGKANG